jgi:hypothetical protein
MASWRVVRGDYAVSDDGKSLLHDRHRCVWRFDTRKGWADLAIVTEGGPYQMVFVVGLPTPDASYWRRSGDEFGLSITKEDVAGMKTDIEAAMSAFGCRCRFVDNERVY